LTETELEELASILRENGFELQPLYATVEAGIFMTEAVLIEMAI
jgi:hypothetical protein